jgi:AcrR family transcriptional regulator
MAERTYHHGDLRRALLDAAVAAVTEAGPGALSMRDLARRAGVSHAGPTHHFRDKVGLLTVLATEGYDLLAEALATAARNPVELGVAYVRFAAGHPAHFQVMFRPDLHRPADPALVRARSRVTETLYGDAVVPLVADGAGAADGARVAECSESDAVMAAWALAHGFATLWLSGALPPLGTDPVPAARTLLTHLPSPASARP